MPDAARQPHTAHAAVVVGVPVPCPTDLTMIQRSDGAAQLAITTERHRVSIDALSSAPLSGRLLLLDL